jgi:hypothetical protein
MKRLAARPLLAAAALSACADDDDDHGTAPSLASMSSTPDERGVMGPAPR